MRIDCPIASAAVYPNMRSAAGFHDVMMLFRSLRDDRVVRRLDDRGEPAAGDGGLRRGRVMSRAIFDAPITRPASS